MALNVRQQRFVDGIIAGKHQAEAYRAAGYTCSAASLETNASALARDPQVSSAIVARRAKVEERVEVTAAMVLNELRRLATCDISQAYDDQGCLKPLKDIPEDVRRCLASIDTEERAPGLRMDQDGNIDAPEAATVIRKARFWSKDRALELLGKNLKLFVDRVEHSVDSTIADRLLRARERTKAKP